MFEACHNLTNKLFSKSKAYKKYVSIYQSVSGLQL